jgi:hypothetical protein
MHKTVAKDSRERRKVEFVWNTRENMDIIHRREMNEGEMKEEIVPGRRISARLYTDQMIIKLGGGGGGGGNSHR